MSHVEIDRRKVERPHMLSFIFIFVFNSKRQHAGEMQTIAMQTIAMQTIDRASRCETRKNLKKKIKKGLVPICSGARNEGHRDFLEFVFYGMPSRSEEKAWRPLSKEPSVVLSSVVIMIAW